MITDGNNFLASQIVNEMYDEEMIRLAGRGELKEEDIRTRGFKIVFVVNDNCSEDKESHYVYAEKNYKYQNRYIYDIKNKILDEKKYYEGGTTEQKIMKFLIDKVIKDIRTERTTAMNDMNSKKIYKCW